MTKRIRAVVTTLVAILVIGMTAPVSAQDKPPSESLTDAAIRDFIMRNPQVIREALAKAEIAEQVERTKRVLSEQSDAIYRSGSPVIGAAEAKLEIVEFFDYNCPYCRKVDPQLRQFIETNPDTHLVLKDIANLGKESEGVSLLAIAARKQSRGIGLHDALMKRQGPNTAAATLELARKLGLDIDALKREAASPETAKVLASNRALASSLNVEGTPLFIIGHHGIAGAPDDWLDQLAVFVGELRQSGCTVC